MGQIKVLDQNMINMIAAGEVIERPASVVKELVENSIDAGATQITVCVEDGGRKLISVTDNGRGIDAEDLRLAFQTHATSKIKTDEDLRSISTLGFRGEALASIASIARVKAISRTGDSSTANSLQLDCGITGEVRPCGGLVGTSIEIRDIFYKLPARRKFLKTANTEMGHISEQFIRIALADCRLQMTLMHNGKQVYHLAANQDLLSRIAELFSAELCQDLIDTESDEKGMHIRALLARPGCSRTTGNLQYVFLNGRYIRDKFISHAIREAYHGLIEADRFPVVFIFIRMPYDEYDVNVHPTKIEVRFSNSNLVHSQILGALREKLLAVDLTEHGTFPQRPISGQTVSQSQPHDHRVTEAMAEFFKRYGPVASQPQLEFPPTHNRRLSAQAQPMADKDFSAAPPIAPLIQPDRKYLQIHDSFIIAETDEGLAIIDQHALHERILYENLYSRLTSGKLESQRLLIPENIELTSNQAEAVRANLNLLEKIGIEMVPFGRQKWVVQAFPQLLAKAEVSQFIKDLIDLLVEATDKSFSPEKLLGDIVSMAACKAAIKAGQKLTDREISQLLEDKQTVERTNCCPHGRPTTIIFSVSQLQKQFKRT